MKSIKMALLGGAALAVTAVGAQADDLEALKAQIEELNARMAAMEAAPAVPAGYQLLTISEGTLKQTPGLEMTARERFNYGDKMTTIAILPTADAPAGAVINWSGYARAALRFRSTDYDVSLKSRSEDDDGFEIHEVDVEGEEDDVPYLDASDTLDDWDVLARGQLRVQASTDTAVGEVGVDIRMRADYDGISGAGSDVYANIAWGYWAMTPELTFGGGFAGTLGDLAYGFDGACTCHYIDTLSMNPGDTSQLRLSYASGPFSMAVAVEDASLDAFPAIGPLNSESDPGSADYSSFDLDDATTDRLGVAGEVKYSGDMFSAEISGMWRDLDEDAYAGAVEAGEDPGIFDGAPVADFLPDSWWQIGAGVSFGMGDIATLSLAGSIGEGPAVDVDDDYTSELYFPWNNSFWAVSGVMAFNMTDEFRAELGGGYRHRDYDEVNWTDSQPPFWDGPDDAFSASAESDYWVVGGGLYYDPVDQLTIGLEASYAKTEVDFSRNAAEENCCAPDDENDYRLNFEADRLTIDLVSVWRF